jgi:hypothetical protein
MYQTVSNPADLAYSTAQKLSHLSYYLLGTVTPQNHLHLLDSTFFINSLTL